MYQEANSDAARVARQKFEDRIERGKASGAKIIEKIMTEVPVDAIVKGRILGFDGEIDDRAPGDPKGLLLEYPFEGDTVELQLHKWPLQQICARTNLAWRYAQHLQASERAGWGTRLLAHNLQELYHHDKSKYLLRSYGGQLRGFLSDRYKRLDSRPLVEAFAGACKDVGAVPIDGYSSDTKVGLSAVLPKIYEPVPNEPISLGCMWENSDYGNGKHDISGFIDRAWCANGLIMSLGFAQIHLGKRLTDDIILSDRTHKLDTMATASAIDDVVRKTMSEDMVELFCDAVKMAHEEKIDVAKAMEGLKKKLSKGEITSITEKFNSPDVEMLPPGNTAWRLSNAISWVAGNEITDAERQVEMMKIAGAIITTRMKARTRRGY